MSRVRWHLALISLVLLLSSSLAYSSDDVTPCTRTTHPAK